MSSGSATGESFACATSVQAKVYSYNYQEGSVVYSIAKAKKGVLEPLVIKIVKVIINKKTFGQAAVLYVDTYNALWNENELCNQIEAKAFAVTYLENLQLELQAQLESCH